MRVKAFKPLFLCAIVSLVAFSLGIWVARGGSELKLGPGGDAQGVAHPKTVRVILPDTLDGQSVPGHGSGLPSRRRDLSPIYPTSPGSNDAAPQLAAATPHTLPPSGEARDAQPTPASIHAEANNDAQEGWDERSSIDVPIMDDTPFGQDTPVSRRLGYRHARGYAHRAPYLVMRRSRPGNPFGPFARLSTSDHGR
ncbi:MAG: hypothetical protein JO188_14300 [Hyphomicrobiales bacterium]|nr:hypothetical protein [Hyphomicrobiales bacterium]